MSYEAPPQAYDVRIDRARKDLAKRIDEAPESPANETIKITVGDAERLVAYIDTLNEALAEQTNKVSELTESEAAAEAHADDADQRAEAAAARSKGAVELLASVKESMERVSVAKFLRDGVLTDDGYVAEARDILNDIQAALKGRQ